MQIHVVGCGDAFGSGGRFNTCFHVTGDSANFLLDCGATSLVALNRTDINRNLIKTILITHFHADHFGGVPFFMLDAQFFVKRTVPLTIAGPHGLKAWFDRAMDTAFPGSSKVQPKFDFTVLELGHRIPFDFEGTSVTPYLVNHGEPGGPFFAYRIEVEGKTLAYTGDTQWTDELLDVGRQADLMIAEAYFRSKQVPLHLDLATLELHLPDIAPKRLLLTHMSNDMLSCRNDVVYECAEDGMILSV